MSENIIRRNTVAKKHTDAGTHYESERKGHADSANQSFILMWVVTIVGTFFDYHIYKPILDRLVYTNSSSTNLLISLGLAALPIIGAWLLAHLTVKIMNRAVRRTWHIFVFVVVLIATVALLVIACWLRIKGTDATASEEHLIYAWTINLVAIAIAIVAFVIHLFLTIRHDKHKNLAKQARIQRDFTEDSGEATRFSGTSHIDNQREINDHKSWCNAHEDLADQTLDRMEISRDVNAQLYANSPEQVRQVKGFPYRIGGEAYGDRANAKVALLKLFNAPINNATHHGYGAPQNCLLDDEAEKVVDDLDVRYRAIINDRPVQPDN